MKGRQMVSRTLFLPLWLCAAALVGLPEETNHVLHAKAASIIASTLRRGFAEDRSQEPQPALDSWSEEQQEAYQAAVNEASLALAPAIPFRVATVIFQANTPWSNTVWIDIGKQTEALPFRIEKNCPVVVRDSLVGLVDFVGKKASRVRLLSDPSVRPAVRVVRDDHETRHLSSAVFAIQRAVAQNPALLPKPEFSTALARLLDCLLQSLPEPHALHLAKGELQGAEYPSSPGILRGVGFNYDFEDELGTRRDLRTGQRSIQDQKILLIKPGDLLETSGLDGVFPRGLRVATVASVAPLEEGAISYRILASADCAEFPHFDHLTVLPAQPEDAIHPPSTVECLSSLIEESSP